MVCCFIALYPMCVCMDEYGCVWMCVALCRGSVSYAPSFISYFLHIFLALLLGQLPLLFVFSSSFNDASGFKSSHSYEATTTIFCCCRTFYCSRHKRTTLKWKWEMVFYSATNMQIRNVIIIYGFRDMQTMRQSIW